MTSSSCLRFPSCLKMRVSTCGYSANSQFHDCVEECGFLVETYIPVTTHLTTLCFSMLVFCPPAPLGRGARAPLDGCRWQRMWHYCSKPVVTLRKGIGGGRRHSSLRLHSHSLSAWAFWRRLPKGSVRPLPQQIYQLCQTSWQPVTLSTSAVAVVSPRVRTVLCGSDHASVGPLQGLQPRAAPLGAADVVSHLAAPAVGVAERSLEPACRLASSVLR
jgi:hypothetical protein